MIYKKPYALFGNGPYPSHPTIKKRLKSIKTFFCTDGGADKLIRRGYSPDVILGDMDSIEQRIQDYSCKIVPLDNQSKNDMEKSLSWCIENGIKELDLFGFSHGRDDQHLANLFIMKNYSNKIKMKMYTDYSLIFCIKNHTNFLSESNQRISLITFNKNTKISTTGLKYSLKNLELKSPSHGISNFAKGTRFSVDPSDWVWVIINYI